MLLGHRHPDRISYPNVWDLPGGHVDPWESIQEAVRRELEEELGIVAALTEQPWRSIVGDGDVVLNLFVVTQWKGEVRNAEAMEHDEIGWFGQAEIGELELAHESYRQVLAEALVSVGRMGRAGTKR